MPKLEKEIGRGQYGVVYSTKNRWAGIRYLFLHKIENCFQIVIREDMKIAIKTMIPDNDSQWGDLSQEYFYMHYWVDRHPNIVQVLGVLIDKKYDVQILSSYIPLVTDLETGCVQASSLFWNGASPICILP